MGEALLVEARATTELLKAAELRDYYRDDCAVETVAVQDVPGAAIVYPIGLPDRLELIVNLPSGLARHTVDVRGEAVGATARSFRRR